MTKKDQIIAMLNAGYDTAQIIARLDVKRHYVYSVRYQLNKDKQEAKPKSKPKAKAAVEPGKFDPEAWMRELTGAGKAQHKQRAYEITVRMVEEDPRELDEVLEHARQYGAAEVTRVIEF